MATQSGPVFSLKDWIISLLFLIGLFITKSLTGHAAASTHDIMGVIMNFLHVLAAPMENRGVMKKARKIQKSYKLLLLFILCITLQNKLPEIWRMLKY